MGVDKGVVILHASILQILFLLFLHIACCAAVFVIVEIFAQICQGVNFYVIKNSRSHIIEQILQSANFSMQCGSDCSIDLFAA